MLTCALKTYVRPNQCGNMLGGVSHIVSVRGWFWYENNFRKKHKLLLPLAGTVLKSYI